MPFRRIAIVNRGDAASRCLRAIRALGATDGAPLTAIALYTEPDRSAPFVRQADVALSLGAARRGPRGAAPRLAYLDRARVLAALRATRAEAVWPGWGFLAEDPTFVAQLEQRGLIFIGPPSAAMRALGDKIAAKRLAESCGVPVVPWSGGAVDAAELEARARALGLPLMIKASAGGGGRGIRAVGRWEDLAAAFGRAGAEAASAFGDATLFLEAVVAPARHIEVQIAADQHGACLALGLRDCSVQRRHQKIIEEAPPPGLAPDVDGALRDAALRLAAAAGYRGVGTVEFLLAADGRSFYFLEINPRLQVEHGLTEMLTGLDLVQLQIRLARGEPLPAAAPAERGHAIEARLCAEDPSHDYAPAPGLIALYDPPGGPGVRVDSGVGPGSAMPAEFDQLIAKVIAHGDTREVALARLAGALDEFRLVVEGGATNKGLLLSLLGHPALRAGAVTVDWLDRTLPALPPPPGGAEALLAAAILLYQEARADVRQTFFAAAMHGPPRAIAASDGQSIELRAGGQPYRLYVLAIGDWSYRVALDGRECVVRLLEQERHGGQLGVGERRLALTYTADATALRIEVDGQPHVIGRDSGGLVRAAGPAVVIAVEVAVGDRVSAGQRLGVLETMKVEVAFAAPFDGTVGAVAVRPNQRVAAGAVLLSIQPHDGAAAPAAGTARLALPDWDDPLMRLFDAAGGPDLAAVQQLGITEREQSLAAFESAVRRVLLGYDRRPDLDARLEALLEAPLPDDLAAPLLEALAGIASALAVFADTEVLFSRRPAEAPGGAVGPSNDAWLRLYVRQRAARGAGLPPPIAALLRRAMQHYGLGELTPGDALDRALLRLYAAQARSETRHRLARALLRYVARLAAAGVDLADDGELAAALGTCVVLRGQVPDDVADAAAAARTAIFELPQIRRRAAAATALVEAGLDALERPGAPAVDLEALQRLADSPPAVFAPIAAWAADAQPRRRAVALQALVLRQYAPRRAHGVRTWTWRGAAPACRIDFASDGIVLAALADAPAADAAWDALCTAAAAEPARPALELLLGAEPPLAEDRLIALAAELFAQRPPPARRACLTALHTDGSRARTVCLDERGTVQALHGLHPETALRLDLGRLDDFDLERLAEGDGVYAFHGRSRSIPDDERLFVLAEVRAALPGGLGTLHEAAFVHAFGEAVRTLRSIRSERDQWGRLHWNRITLVVRPALYLLPATLDRLIGELTPAIHHLGLEKIVVRLTLREAPDAAAERPRELVVEPTAGGRVALTWRDPHGAPLRPASADERRRAQARRRGVVHPYEAIQLFTAAPGSRFDEYDLADDGAPPRAVSVAGRPPGRNRAGVVFGLISTPSAAHPEGLQRVLIVSDPTRDMGALSAAECDRLVAGLDLAAARGVPVEWLATSAGARIAMDSGTENLDATARVARRIIGFTRDGGEINLLVAGVNVGAQSYFDALATMLMGTRGILVMLAGTAMVLTGRLALEASGGVAAEDEVGIGGFERVMGPNGQAQYYAHDLAEAHDLLMRHYGYTYRAAGEARPRRRPSADPRDRSLAEYPYPASEPEGFATVGEIFDDAANPGRKRPFAMRPVMQALIDQDGGWLERWGAMGGAETAIVWDARLGGQAISLIGIESRNVPRLGQRASDGPEQWSGGTLFPLSSKKIARALGAASGNRPVVVLANLSGFDGSPESMRTLQLEYGAEIARAVVAFDGPLLFVVVSRYHGGAYVVFSRALNDRLYAVALEGSYASVIGGGAAATAVFGRDVQARTDADPRVQAARAALRTARDSAQAAALQAAYEHLREVVRLEQHGALAQAFDAAHDIARACRVGSLDAVVAAAQLRPHLIDRLQ